MAAQLIHNVRTRSTLAAMLFCAAVAAAPAVGQTQPSTQERAMAPKADADVPVKSVTLFSSGVGYFQHAGTVNGNADTTLRFDAEDVNDILKSLVLQDLDGGSVGVVRYPSQDPLEKQLASFGIDVTSADSLPKLLQQLRGATITLNGPGVTGVVVSVETIATGEGDKATPKAAVTLLTDGQLKQYLLETAGGITFQDEQLKQELTRALTAMATSRNASKKPVEVTFRGDGDRRVSLGYVVEAPVWKTSYRLVLQDDSKAALQGWAIVENQTDQDWTDVQLSLVSGRPISFVQDLYNPIYLQRPTVEPERYESLKPQAYAGGRESQRAMEKAQNEPMLSESMNRSNMGRGAPMAAMMEADAIAPIDPTASVSAAASAANLGELFQFTVGSVSIPRQSSAMIPIITDPLEAERVTIFNASVLPRHPLNGAIIENSTGKSLPGGPITVYDGGNNGGYQGDAQINDVPPDQDRLISFGIDLPTVVDTTTDSSDAIVSGKIVKGVLEVTRQNVWTTSYAVDNTSDKAKTLVLEQPKIGSAELVDSAEPYETTDVLYRFKHDLPAKKETKVTVKQRQVYSQQMQLVSFDLNALMVYARTGSIDPKVRDALTKAAEFKRQEFSTQRSLDQAIQNIAELSNEQARVRSNLGTVDRNSDFYGSQMKKLQTTEDQIDQYRKRQDELETKLNADRKALEDYLAGLNVE